MLPLPRHLLSGPGSSPALITEDGQISFGALRARAETLAKAWFPAREKALVFCFLSNGLDLIVAYLASIYAGQAIALLPPATPPARLRDLVRAYRPQICLGPDLDLARDLASLGYAPGDSGDIGSLVLRAAPDGEIHPDLAVLLSTSGSTGTPKLVRLSAAALIANSAGIAAVTGIEAGDRAITGLPLYHSYGLSVLNSHLASSSAVVATGLNPINPRFWYLADQQRVTEIAATPTVHRAIFSSSRRLPVPRLVRRILQAGARFPPDLAPRVADWMDETGGSFFSMYGQTEATARISCLDPAAFRSHPRSVGTALPGGTISVPPREPGQDDGPISYSGPNVMMGYATGRTDLARGHDCLTLQTGDLGYLDADGLLYVTGRASRFTMVLDRRVSLDDVGDWFGAGNDCVAVPAADSDAIVVFTTAEPSSLDEARRGLAATLGASNAMISLRAIESIPLTGSGKIDYATLEQIARARPAARSPAAPTGPPR